MICNQAKINISFNISLNKSNSKVKNLLAITAQAKPQNHKKSPQIS
jgi:hypothetical protein